MTKNQLTEEQKQKVDKFIESFKGKNSIKMMLSKEETEYFISRTKPDIVLNNYKEEVKEGVKTFKADISLVQTLLLRMQELSHKVKDKEHKKVILKDYNYLLKNLVDIFVFREKREGKELLRLEWKIERGKSKTIQKNVEKTLAKEYILNILNTLPKIPIDTKPPSNYIKTSLPLIENLAKPMTKNSLPEKTLFDIAEENKNNIDKREELKAEVTIKGIKPKNSAHSKMILTLQRLLHDKSNLDLNSSDYYLGDTKELLEEGYSNLELVSKVNDAITGAEIKRNIPYLRVNLEQIGRYYHSKNKLSGRDRDQVIKYIKELETEFFNIEYDREFKESYKGNLKNQIVGQKVKVNESLVRVIEFTETRRNEGEENSQTKQEYILKLNPIFIENIDKIFVLIPEDIVERIKKAYPSKGKPHNSVYNLYNFLLFKWFRGNQFFKNGTLLIKKDYLDLLRDVCTGLMNKRDKAGAIEKLNIALETLKNPIVGIINKYEVKEGKAGEVIHITLNEDF